MSIYWILFFVSFSICAVGLLFWRKVSIKIKLLLNKKDDTPQIGGVVFSFVFVLCFFGYVYLKGIALPFDLAWIFISALVLLLIEFFDDIKDFSLRTRIVVQLLFVIFFLWQGKRVQIYFLPEWANYLVSFLWIVGITNVFNLLDIKDGLCSGISFVVGLSFLSVLLISNDSVSAVALASLCGVVLAFLFFNFPKAKMYMGNSGSHVLGFLFASFSVYGDYATLANRLALLVPLIILAFPIIDTAFLIIARIKKGIVPIQKSNDHLFMKLVDSGWSFSKTLYYIYVVNVLWGLSAVYVILNKQYSSSVFLLISALATLFIVVRPGRNNKSS